MVIFVHIPKTAGTSLGRVFAGSCSQRILYDYDPDYKNAVMQPGEEESIAAHKDFILSRFEYIHGHFYLSKYKKVLPDATYVTCFRHPVERIISQYQHLHSQRAASSTYAPDIQSGQMDIVEFASQPNIGNAQVVHMDGYGLDDLDFFFLTERLPQGVRLFNRVFGKRVPNPPLLNAAAQRRAKAATFSDAQLEEVARVAEADMALYRDACARYRDKNHGMLRRPE